MISGKFDANARADGCQKQVPIVLPLFVALSRAQLEALIDVMIERLNLIDGDTDFEANGDEQDSSNAEDEFCSTGLQGTRRFQVGCRIADTG